MHKYERDELRRIVKGRFEVLHAQLAQRREEIAQIVRQEIREEHKAAMGRIQVKAKKLEEKQNKLAGEARELLAEARALNLAPQGGGLEYIARDRVAPETWAVINESARVNDAVKKVQIEAGAAGLNLRHEELKLYEQLATEAIETDEAKKFFDSIPGVDNILPLPTPKKVKELV